MPGPPGEPQVDILVHIAAPSHAADDAYYRSLAAAYLEFDPIRSLRLDSVAVPDELASPQLSFADVLDNLGSPAARLPCLPLEGRHSSPADSQVSWEPPPSTVEDSQPYDDVSFADFCHPDRIIEYQLEKLARDPASGPELYSSSSSDTRSSPQLPERPPISSRESSPHTASPSQLPLQHDTDVEVPSSPPLASRPSPVLIDTSFAVETSFAAEAIQVPDRAGSEPLASKPQGRSGHGPAAGVVERSASHVFSRSQAAPSAPRGAWLDALQVWGPEPPVSVRHLEPDDLLTPHLRKLQRDLGAPKRYAARLRLLQGRVPDPLERGRWVLDCAGLADRRPVWEYLARYVHAGNAGWSVSLMRDSPATARISVYCFAHLAAHVYLLLYTATERRIYGLDCTWSSSRYGDMLFVPATKTPAEF